MFKTMTLKFFGYYWSREILSDTALRENEFGGVSYNIFCTYALISLSI